ncbi:MAG: oligosaccharide flippase family protein [Azospirillum sp.]|nr:oligosaccharide flippase family protein [Azospirillum sp.]
MRRLLRKSAWFFLSTMASTVITIAVLPIATRRLGPDDYGSFILATTIGSLILGIASTATGYSLATHLATLGGVERRRLVSSAAAAVTLATGLLGVVLVPAAFLGLPHLVAVDSADLAGFLLVMTGTVLGAPWVVAAEVLTIDGRAAAFSAAMILQAVVNAAVLLVCLLGLELGRAALFIGQFSGSVAILAATLATLGRDLSARPSRAWLGQMAHAAPALAGANLAESALTFFERYYLAHIAGIGALGLYGHAQQYRAYAMSLVNAVSRAMWPINLAEARQEPVRFEQTARSWALVQIGITAIGLTMALTGREIIGALTNGKFADAHVAAVLLIIGLLLQSCGKADMAWLIARGHGRAFAHLMTVATLSSLVALVGLVAWLGMVGAALAGLVRYACLRITVHVVAIGKAPIPFLDHWALAGIGLTGGALATVLLWSPALPWRLGGLVALLLGLAWLARGRFLAMLGQTEPGPGDSVLSPIKPAVPAA